MRWRVPLSRFRPNRNLVCVALYPAGNRDLGVANGFVRRSHDQLRVAPGAPLQGRNFFGCALQSRTPISECEWSASPE